MYQRVCVGVCGCVCVCCVWQCALDSIEMHLTAAIEACACVCVVLQHEKSFKLALQNENENILILSNLCLSVCLFSYFSFLFFIFCSISTFLNVHHIYLATPIWGRQLFEATNYHLTVWQSLHIIYAVNACQCICIYCLQTAH